MEHTSANPFVPRASLIKCPNGVFEIHLHLPGVVSDVEVTPFDTYLLVSGRLVPRSRTDVEGKAIELMWTDQACGHFGRDIPINLSRGTECIVLDYKHICDDYVVRFTIRNVGCNPSLDIRNASNRGNACASCVALGQTQCNHHSDVSGPVPVFQTHWGQYRDNGCGCGCAPQMGWGHRGSGYWRGGHHGHFF